MLHSFPSQRIGQPPQCYWAKIRIPGAVVALVMAAQGCARVEPQQDYAAVSSRIKDRIGALETYNPTIEAQIKEKTAALLADGLRVEEAVSVALLNNASFQSMFQAIGASRADVVQSGLLTNPSLVIGARFPEAGGRSEITFGFAQQLVDLWQIPVRKNIAQAELDQTVLHVLDEALRIATTTRSRCYEYLWRQRLSEIATGNHDLAERSVRLAEVRFKAGEANPLDVGLVRTKLFETQNTTVLAARDLENARLALSQILGLARTGDEWILIDEFSTVDLPGAEDQLLSAAIENRFDVQMAEARIQAAEKAIDLQLLKVFPNLEIGLQGERTERRALPRRIILADTARASVAAGQLTAPRIESKGQRDLARRQIIDSMLGPSIAFTLPIWDQNQAQIAKAHFNHVRLLKERENLLDTVVTEVRQAINNARAASDQSLFFQTEVLPQVDATLKSATSRYENGEDSVLVLIEAQETVFLQKRLSVDAVRNELIALAELTQAVGGRWPVPTSQPQNDGQ